MKSGVQLSILLRKIGGMEAAVTNAVRLWRTGEVLATPKLQ
jgi:hypothetical protein